MAFEYTPGQEAEYQTHHGWAKCTIVSVTADKISFVYQDKNGHSQSYALRAEDFHLIRPFDADYLRSLIAEARRLEGDYADSYEVMLHMSQLADALERAL